MTMQEMAEAMGLAVVEVPGLDGPRWVSDCAVVLLPADLNPDGRDEAIAWAVEHASESAAT